MEEDDIQSNEKQNKENMLVKYRSLEPVFHENNWVTGLSAILASTKKISRGLHLSLFSAKISSLKADKGTPLTYQIHKKVFFSHYPQLMSDEVRWNVDKSSLHLTEHLLT